MNNRLFQSMYHVYKLVNHEEVGCESCGPGHLQAQIGRVCEEDRRQTLVGPDVFDNVLRLVYDVLRPSLFTPILQQQVQTMRRTPLPIYVWPFPANIARRGFHGRRIIEANLNNLRGVHSNNVAFDLGGHVGGILCATGGVDGTEEHVARRTNLHDVHQRAVDNILPSVRTNSAPIFVDG